MALDRSKLSTAISTSVKCIDVLHNLWGFAPRKAPNAFISPIQDCCILIGPAEFHLVVIFQASFCFNFSAIPKPAHCGIAFWKMPAGQAPTPSNTVASSSCRYVGSALRTLFMTLWTRSITARMVRITVEMLDSPVCVVDLSKTMKEMWTKCPSSHP